MQPWFANGFSGPICLTAMWSVDLRLVSTDCRGLYIFDYFEVWRCRTMPLCWNRCSGQDNGADKCFEFLALCRMSIKTTWILGWCIKSAFVGWGPDNLMKCTSSHSLLPIVFLQLLVMETLRASCIWEGGWEVSLSNTLTNSMLRAAEPNANLSHMNCALWFHDMPLSCEVSESQNT